MPSSIYRTLVCGTWLLAATVATANGSMHGIYAQDLQGRVINQVDQLGPTGAQVVVLTFAATDCPISRRYIPEIARIQQKMTPKGVAFWWIFPNPDDTASKVRQHEVDYSIHSATLIDSKQDLVRMAHVAVTPEVAVFKINEGKLTEVYHGRIDDRYESFGHERPQATTHDLEDAIRATLQGRAVRTPRSNPVGCSIVPIATKP